MLERLGRALWVNAETEAALEAHEAAVRIMPAEPPTAELARVLSGYGQILMLLDRWSESTVLCKRAVDIARDVGARQVEGHALNTYGLDLAVGGRCEEGFAELEASLAIAREVANADDIGRGYNNLGEARRVCGDVRGALEVTRAGVAAAEEIGLSRTYGTFIGANGVSYGFDLGLWEEADRTAEAYVATHQMSRPQRRYGLTRWLPLLVAEGDDRVDASLDELRMLLEGVPVEAQFHSPYRLSIAESALWRGEPDKALGVHPAGARRDPAVGVAALPPAALPGRHAGRRGPGRGRARAPEPRWRAAGHRGRDGPVGLAAADPGQSPTVTAARS